MKMVKGKPGRSLGEEMKQTGRSGRDSRTLTGMSTNYYFRTEELVLRTFAGLLSRGKSRKVMSLKEMIQLVYTYIRVS